MKYLLGLIFSSAALLASAQQVRYFGKIVDSETQETIAYATIAFFQDTSLLGGTATDENGDFSYIHQTPMTRAVVHFMGYKKYQIATTNWEPDEPLLIPLESIANDLEEVIINGESTQIQRQVDKKIIKLGTDIQQAGGSALTAFDYLPEVEIDLALGTVALRGSNNVRILVNSQLSPLLATELLQQIPAHTIQSIEIITTPSAKYRSEGLSGIINIVLKQENQNGLNWQANASVGTGRYGIGYDGNYHKNKVNLRWKASANQLDIIDRQSIQRTFSNGYTEHITTPRDMNGSIRNLALGGDLFLNAQHTFSIDLNYTDDQHDYYNLSQFSELKDQPDYSYLRENTHDHHILNWNANYRWTFGKGQFLEFDYNLNQSNNDYPLRDSQDDQIRFDQFLTEDFVLGTIALDYIWPISEDFALESGLSRNTQVLESTRSHQPRDAPDEFAAFDYQETLWSWYGQVRFPIKAFDIQAGLRYESFASEALSVSNNFSTQQTFLNLFPSLHIRYAPNEQTQFHGSYSKRVSRPNFHQINAFQIVSPFYTWEYNPNITPEFSDNLELHFQHLGERFRINTTLSYRNRKDAILWQESAQDNRQIFQYINAGSFQSYGLEIGLTQRWQPTWTSRLSANFYYTSIDQQALVTYDHNYSGAFSFRNSIKLGKSITTDISYLYWPERQASFNQMQARQRLDWAIGTQFLKSKLRLQFRIVDLFNTYLIDRSSITPNLVQQTIWKIQNQRRNFLLSMSYQIRENENTKRKRKARKYNEVPID